MAARRTKTQNDSCKEKIKTSQLLNRVMGIALGTITADAVQVSAIKLLLNKTLPDLKAIEVTGDPNNPLEIVTKVDWCIVEPSKSK